jgi:hypothetical protein
VEHHNTTLWRDAQPVDNNAMPAFWNMGGAWLATHLWQRYLFTGDRQDLALNYPALKGAAEFCADWLVDDGKGRLVTAAGGSPEIEFNYIGKNGTRKTAGICVGPTMGLPSCAICSRGRSGLPSCWIAIRKLLRDWQPAAPIAPVIAFRNGTNTDVPRSP